MSEQEMLPERETRESLTLNSPYFDVALGVVREKIPEKESQIRRVLEVIDREGVENFSLFRPKDYPGVALPFTRINVTKLTNELFGLNSEPKRQEKEQGTISSPRRLYFIFPGFAFPPAGHPFTPWDIVYDRVISLFPQIINPIRKGETIPQIEVLVLGSPNGLGGKVSEEWVTALKDKGIPQYGQVSAEFVRKALPEEQNELENTWIILQGMSMGSTVAEHTYLELPELKQKLQLLLDNPAGLHERVLALLKGIQIPLGFLGEATVRGLFDQRVRNVIEAENVFLKKLEEMLQQRGIIEKDNQEQKKLKRKAALTDALNLIKGSSFDTESIRSFIRQGLYDPTSFSPSVFLRTLLQTLQGKTPVLGKGRSLTFPILATHFINRYRVEKWGRIIDFASKH